jgi:hypothetical protein
MAQIFTPRANLLARILPPVLLVLVVGGLFGLGWFFHWSDFNRQVGEAYAPKQPVPFSHQLHVTAYRIDCRYCHSKVEVSGYANLPSTQTCMSCHSVIKTDSPRLQPVRDSWANDTPIEWVNVHDLPQFVYFNHSSHVAKGVGCSSCHGNIANMGANLDLESPDYGKAVWKTQGMFMSWCLGCHRAPEQHVRPAEEIYNTAYVTPPNQAELGARLVDEYRIRGANQLTNCVICHR